MINLESFMMILSHAFSEEKEEKDNLSSSKSF